MTPVLQRLEAFFHQSCSRDGKTEVVGRPLSGEEMTSHLTRPSDPPSMLDLLWALQGCE